MQSLKQELNTKFEARNSFAAPIPSRNMNRASAIVLNDAPIPKSGNISLAMSQGPVRAKPIQAIMDDRPIKPMDRNEVEKNFSKVKQEVIWGSSFAGSELKGSSSVLRGHPETDHTENQKDTLWRNKSLLSNSHKDLRSEKTHPLTEATHSEPQTHREPSSTASGNMQNSRPSSQMRSSNILTWDNPYDSRI